MKEVFIFSGERQLEAGSHRHSLYIAHDVETAKEILCHQKYCLILIDLVAQPEEGMELARFIRGLPGHYLTPIVFLAENFQYERQAFHEIHCYDYLIKPICKEDIIQIIYLYLTRLFPEKKGEIMRFRIHGATYLVNIKDIIYMETMNRSVFVHMTAGKIIEVPYLKLQDCVKEHGDTFIQCHRSILVNRDYVRGIDGLRRRLELAGCPDRVEIGRTFEQKIRQEFEAW